MGERALRLLPLTALLFLPACNAASSGVAPSIEAGPRATEAFVAGADGVRLFVRRLGSGKDPIVYLHGGPASGFRGSGEYMEPLAAGRTLLMYDQRGAGLSDLVAEPAKLTLEANLRDLEALRRHFGFQRMTLIGLSWGSGLAAAYADRYPDRVDRLVLVSPMPPSKALFDARMERLDALLGAAAVKRRAQLGAKLATATDAEAVAACREIVAITFRLYLADPTRAKLRHAARRCDIPTAAIRHRALVQRATFASLGQWDFRPMLSRLRVPALVIEGERTLVPLEATRIWADLIPDARLVLIPAAGHEFFVDQPAAFVGEVERFLRSPFSRGPSRE